MKNNQAFTFVLLLALGYFGFQMLDNFLFKCSYTSGAWNQVYQFFRSGIILTGREMLKAMGYEAFSSWNKLWVTGVGGVRVANVCVGIDLMANLAILVMAYPGNWKLKLLVIPVGMLAVMSLNVLRVAGIVYCQIHHYSFFDYFDPHDSFNLVIYFITFFIWLGFTKLNDELEEPIQESKGTVRLETAS